MHIIDERVFKTMRFHVFNLDSEPVGVFLQAIDAAMMVSCLGDGSFITDPNSKTLWTEGPYADGCAGASYDKAAETICLRLVQ